MVLVAPVQDAGLAHVQERADERALAGVAINGHSNGHSLVHKIAGRMKGWFDEL